MTTFLSPTNDIAFKKIFGETKNKDILIHFLNDVLHKQDENVIHDVTIINPTQLPEIAGSKESILDVLCTDTDGSQYIVEMQVAGQKGFEKRAQYYAAKAYSRQAKESDKYDYLKEVIFLAILDFEMFPDKEYHRSNHAILDTKTYAHDLKDFSFTFIELPKFIKTKPEELLTYEDKWCYFFKHASEPDNMRHFLSTITDESKVIERAYGILEAHNWTEEELLQYERMEKINRDAKARLAYAIEKGIKKGIERGILIGEQKGREATKLQIVKELLRDGMDVLRIAKIVHLDELQVEEVKKSLEDNK
ncbi:MAG: Rpn family recombination-promoting nuclease/putative transposase [Burkholderiales bacterium]|nr:Rpn family recombination-promoting nuclease/putative transposase [Burkholderiales bacterium]